MEAKDLSKQQALDADTKPIKQINFTGYLIRKNSQDQNLNYNKTMFFIIEEVKETVISFSQRIVKVFWIYFTLI